MVSLHGESTLKKHIIGGYKVKTRKKIIIFLCVIILLCSIRYCYHYKNSISLFFKDTTNLTGFTLNEINVYETEASRKHHRFYSCAMIDCDYDESVKEHKNEDGFSENGKLCYETDLVIENNGNEINNIEEIKKFVGENFYKYEYNIVIDRKVPIEAYAYIDKNNGFIAIFNVYKNNYERRQVNAGDIYRVDFMKLDNKYDILNKYIH